VPALLAGATILAATLPLWVLPHLSLDPITVQSFRFEFPLKGLDFWLSGFLAVCGSVILARLWAMPRRRWLARAYVSAALILPLSMMLPLGQDEDHSSAGLIGMSWRQVKLAASGYWRGWGYPRRVVGRADREFFVKLRSLVDSGDILENEHVAHIAESGDLHASPFPAFTGIAQDMYLPHVDTADVHTHGGRLYDIDDVKPGNRWVVVEKTMLPKFPVESSSVVYENDRLLLLRRGG
jgi:hypothetical protein